ncbi:MAG: DUF4214 domain-containing protein [Pseudomonadota bacterium]
MLDETPGFFGPFGPGGFDFPTDVTDDLQDVIGGAAGDPDAPTDDGTVGDDGAVDGADEIPDAGDGDVTSDTPDGEGEFLLPTDGVGAVSSITLPSKTFTIPENFTTGLQGGVGASPGLQTPTTTFQTPTSTFQFPTSSFNAPGFASGDFGSAIEIEEPDSPFDFSGAIFDPTIDFPVFVEDVPGVPGSISVGGTVTGFISDSFDNDLFEISLDAGTTVVIDAFAPEGSTLDTLVAVIDPSGDTLVENDDFNIFENFDSKVVFTAPTTSTFTIAVGGFFTSAGDFGLTVTPFEDALTEVQELALLYEAAFGRSADAEGLNFWLDALEGGLSLTEIAERFIESDEFVSLFGEIDTLSDTEIVTTFFENVLDRGPDPEGLDFFVGVLGTPEVDPEDLLLTFALSPENLQSSLEVLLLETNASGNISSDSDFFVLGDVLF